MHDGANEILWAQVPLIHSGSDSGVLPTQTIFADPSQSHDDDDDRGGSETDTDIVDEEKDDQEQFHDEPQMFLPEVFPSYSHLVDSVSDLYHEGSCTEEED